jgi:NADH dehydrogenase
MRVLVTGGTGVIGEGLIPALVGAGHTVRLLSRGAEGDAGRWPSEVEPFAADVTDASSLRGAADDCGAVVHVTGIVDEAPPALTFERVNVQGTRNVLAEAARAGLKRFVYVSSLGAERGRSGYHRSKFKAEELVRASAFDWLILRPGNVYGPGDEVISTLLKLVRALPAVPVIDAGDQPFQPVWYEDLGKAILNALETPALKRQTLELAGAETTSTSDLIKRLSNITGRQVARVPVPSFLASLGVRLAEGTKLEKLLGVKLPLNDAKLKMLLEGNFIEHPSANALTARLGVEPTPLDVGLARLADSIPEQLPSEGVGPLRRKRFWADIQGSRLTPTKLVEEFRARCAEVMPLEFSAEPGTPRVVEEGTTLTLGLPLRGNVQVRVEEVAPRRVTFSTVGGHVLAGMIQFSASGDRRKTVRFLVETHTRAATTLDLLAMSAVGESLQQDNWEEVVTRVVSLSGGAAPLGVQSETATLDDEEARRVERRLNKLIDRRKREEVEPPKGSLPESAPTPPAPRRTAAKNGAAKKRATKRAPLKATIKIGKG